MVEIVFLRSDTIEADIPQEGVLCIAPNPVVVGRLVVVLVYT